MTKYIKTGATEFEQFDGSDEMIDKYELIDAGTMLGIHHSTELYLTGSGKVDVGDWIATGVNGEHWPVHDEIFQKTYKRLLKLTRPLSRYLEHCKERWNLNDAFLNAEYLVPNNNDALEVFEYLSEHPEDFARAWLDGYEVQDEN